MSFLVKLIMVVAVVGGVVGAFYYFASPYQNCKRGFEDPTFKDMSDGVVILECATRTNW